MISSGIGSLIAVAALVTPGLIWEPVRPWLFAGAGVAGAIGLLVTTIMPFVRFHVHRWEVTSMAVYAKTGWLSREWKIAPLSRVQTVEAKRNPLHQALGLAQVSVTTASSRGAIVIEGLDRDIADKIVAELTVATENTTGDAT